MLELQSVIRTPRHAMSASVRRTERGFEAATRGTNCTIPTSRNRQAQIGRREFPNGDRAQGAMVVSKLAWLEDRDSAVRAAGRTHVFDLGHPAVAANPSELGRCDRRRVRRQVDNRVGIRIDEC